MFTSPNSSASAITIKDLYKVKAKTVDRNPL